MKLTWIIQWQKDISTNLTEGLILVFLLSQHIMSIYQNCLRSARFKLQFIFQKGMKARLFMCDTLIHKSIPFLDTALIHTSDVTLPGGLIY